MVSIILPTYNRAKLLQASIQSVLQQSYTDFELIIIDDGSEDDTKGLVLSIRDERIKYYYLPHTGYTSRTKNFAIQRSSGDYIAFIDSDDTWKPGKLGRQVELLDNNPSAGFSITDVTTFRDDTVLIDHTYHLQNTTKIVNIFEWMKQSRFIVYNPTLIIRKSCLERIGYYDESIRAGCYNFNMLLAYHFDAAIIYETLVMRRVHDDNWSEQIPFDNYREYIHTFEYMRQERMIEGKYLRKALGNAYYKMGKMHAANGNWREARRHYIVALKNNLFRPRYVLSLLGTYSAGRSAGTKK